ncbi:Protein lin-52 [Chionoecetes opilio]|uniref:Protein lin-52 n=1 Tax=Chionoecetes opilio TaxID=41210 RepID=A0A8J4YDB7_CHIOP|nr:Protein lin-52 [Chionoecetes opilio]
MADGGKFQAESKVFSASSILNVEEYLRPHTDSTEMEPSLLSLEKLDRSSPDLWPEQMPGVYDFAPLLSPQLSPGTQNLDLEEQDFNLLYQFRLLTALEIIEEVKKLQNVAYQLGLEEAKEMTRGKYLHILNNKKSK